MKNFKDSGFRNKGKDFGGRPKFGAGQSSRVGARGPRLGEKKELFSATCSSCHKSCEVPFRPSADKPVYCSVCFNKRDNESNQTDRNDRRSDTGRTNNSYPVRADSAKPVRPENNANNRELGEIKRQLITIEARLNRILDIINPPLPAVKTVSVEKLPAKKAKPEALKAVVKKEVASKKVAKKAVKKTVKKVAKKAVK